MTPNRILDMQDIWPPANGRALSDELSGEQSDCREPYCGLRCLSPMGAQFRFERAFSPHARVPRFYLKTATRLVVYCVVDDGSRPHGMHRGPWRQHPEGSFLHWPAASVNLRQAHITPQYERLKPSMISAALLESCSADESRRWPLAPLGLVCRVPGIRMRSHTQHRGAAICNAMRRCDDATLCGFQGQPRSCARSPRPFGLGAMSQVCGARQWLRGRCGDALPSQPVNPQPTWRATVGCPWWRANADHSSGLFHIALCLCRWVVNNLRRGASIHPPTLPWAGRAPDATH